MAEIEKLIVELDAKVDGYVRDMEKARGKNKDFGNSATRMAGKLKDAFIAIGAAAGAGLTAATIAATSFAKELGVAANRADESVERMQALSFATGTVGISLEKLGDISKDTRERVGEFVSSGTGGLNDFIEVMGMTTDEGRALALELQNLSGPDILQRLVSEMDKAGKTTEQMQFALEGLASDTTDLIPLLVNQGAELNKLTAEFDSLNITLSQMEVNNLRELGAEVSKIGAITEGVTGKTVSAIDDQIKAILENYDVLAVNIGEVIVRAVTGIQVVTSGVLGGVTNAIRETQILYKEFEIFVAEVFDGIITKSKEGAKAYGELLLQMQGVQLPDSETVTEPLDRAVSKVQELKNELAELEAKDRILDDAAADHFEAMMDRMKESVAEFKGSLEEVQPDEAVQEEQAENQLEAERNLLNERLKMTEAFYKERGKLLATEAKDEEKTTEKSELSKLNTQQATIRAGMALNTAFFEDNKAVNAGLIVADTAAAIMSSLRINPYDYANVALIAATGAANLANALSASKGGGSISGGGGGATITNQQSDFVPETAALTVTEQDFETGARDIKITISTDDGKDLIDTIGQELEIARNEGRV